MTGTSTWGRSATTEKDTEMSDSFNIHDLFHLASIILMTAVTITALKADVRWIRKWCDEHKEDDDRRFEEVKQDIREVRQRE